MPRRPNSSRQTRILIAAFLDRSHKWRHGYDLSKETGIKSGTLYPLLMRLCDQGFLEAVWQEPDRSGLPPRHAYKLTVQGLMLAQEQARDAAAPAPADCLGALT
jgi:PadR family transcriptional regulator PadR